MPKALFLLRRWSRLGQVCIHRSRQLWSTKKENLQNGSKELRWTVQMDRKLVMIPMKTLLNLVETVLPTGGGNSLLTHLRQHPCLRWKRAGTKLSTLPSLDFELSHRRKRQRTKSRVVNSTEMPLGKLWQVAKKSEIYGNWSPLQLRHEENSTQNVQKQQAQEATVPPARYIKNLWDGIIHRRLTG